MLHALVCKRPDHVDEKIPKKRAQGRNYLSNYEMYLKRVAKNPHGKKVYDEADAGCRSKSWDGLMVRPSGAKCEATIPEVIENGADTVAN